MKHWTTQDEATLAALYQTMSVGQLAAHMNRTRASIKGRISKLGLKKPAGFGNTGRFLPGHKSWNKGMKGLDTGGSAGRFKPGHLGGRAAELKQPIGAESYSKDGYLQRKVSNDSVFYKRWKFVHIIVWEQAHGPVPQGDVIAFINGDKADLRIDNLECISRREIMRRNTVHNYPDELRKVMRLKATITRRINRHDREESQP